MECQLEETGPPDEVRCKVTETKGLRTAWRGRTKKEVHDLEKRLILRSGLRKMGNPRKK